MIVLEVGVDDFERLVVGESDLTYVVEGIGDQSEEMVSILDGFGGGFEEIFSKLAKKLLSMSLAVALRPGFFLIREGSSAMPSFCWYWRT